MTTVGERDFRMRCFNFNVGAVRYRKYGYTATMQRVADKGEATKADCEQCKHRLVCLVNDAASVTFEKKE